MSETDSILEYPEVREKQVIIEGIKVHYLDTGEGFPTLLLHGWPTSSYLWRNIYPDLSECGRIIIPDLPGYGKSDKLTDIDYSVSAQAERLNLFLEELQVEKLNLVIHDLGGTIGLLYAVRNPERIDKLVITDTIIFPELKGILFSMRLLILFSKIPVLRAFLASDYIIKRIMKTGIYRRSKLNDTVIAGYLSPFNSKQDKKVYLKNIADFEKEEGKEIILNSGLLKMPKKIICADKDFMMKEEMFRIKELFPEAEFELLRNASHFLQEDQPEVLTDLLIDFLYKQV